MPDRLKQWLLPEIEFGPERAAYITLVASASLVLVSIAASQIMLAAAIGTAVWARHKRPQRAIWLPLFTPLVLFLAWTMAAAFASSDIPLGLGISKKFFIFLLLLLVPWLLRGEGRPRRAFHAIFVGGLLASGAGLVQFVRNPHRDLLHRISGFMSHWMTYSGLLMLVLVVLAAYGITYGWRRHPWVVGGIVLLAVPVSLSQTRNTIIGAVAGILVIFLLRRPRAIIGIVGVLVVAYMLAPAAFRQRLRSGWDLNDPNTRNRIELLGTSVRMIRANPVFGVGPKNVKIEALRYRGSNEYPDWLYQHMHNNFLQIAAERGLPGLALWIWFMARLAYDSWRLYVRARAPSSDSEALRNEALLCSLAALGAWVALLISGLFEYNFGDSEVLTLFLFLMSAPYAAASAFKQDFRSAVAAPATSQLGGRL